MILAIIWAILFFILTGALWLKKARTRLLIPGIFAIYALYRLALVGIFAQSDYSRGSILISVLLYSLAISFMTWALYRRAGGEYLGIQA
jgi:hypothetical protein